MTRLTHSFKSVYGPSPSLSDLEDLGLMDPRWIVQELDKYVIGQHQAKKTLSLMMLNRSLVILNRHKMIELAVPVQKSNVLLMGPTGTGKTALVKALAEVCGFPILTFDVTALTATGFAGMDTNSILNNYIDHVSDYAYDYCKQHSDEELPQGLINKDEFINHILEVGIVYLDEIDKIKSNGGNGISVDGYGISIQNELLKYLDGAKISLKKQYGADADGVTNKLKILELDTSNIYFIVGGAFHGLADIIAHRLYSGASMGFTGSVDHKSTEKDEASLFHQATTQDLIAYGFRPEFLGRVPLRAALNQHTKGTIKKIILESHGSVFLQYKELLKIFKVDLLIDAKALDEIASVMLKMNMGARALKGIFNDILQDLLFNIFDGNKKEFIITKKLIKKHFGDR